MHSSFPLSHLQNAKLQTKKKDLLVGARQLLQSLKGHTEENPVCHTRAREDFVPRVFSSTGLFGLEFSLNLLDFALDLWMVFRNTIGKGNGVLCTVRLALAVLPSRRLLHEKDTENHNRRPYEADTHRKLPCVRAAPLFGAKVDAVGGEDAESNEELVAGYESTADIAGCSLRLVPAVCVFSIHFTTLYNHDDLHGRED
jgi:hypothetical protein